MITLTTRGIKSLIYKKLKALRCDDIARMKMVRKIMDDCTKGSVHRELVGKLFIEEVYEERGREFYIQLGELDWQFTEQGKCVHGGLLSLSKATIEMIKKMEQEQN